LKEIAMKLLILGRQAFGIGAAAALLAACAGSSRGVMPSGVTNADQAPIGNKTFKYTGAQQSFTVPTGVTRITVVARGAAGGGEKCIGSYCYPHNLDYFGRGGRVYAIIPVRPGETLYVDVGGQGSDAAGGFDGGGKPGPGGGSYGGGGASDVREGGDSLSNRVLVAGGGGGQGGSRDAVGGRGGGAIGGNGGSYCYRGSSCIGGGAGAGGTQRQGGSGGEGGDSYEPGQPGNPGTFGIGGNGGSGGCYYGSGNCGCGYANGCPGAGGGGGYYGAGGGGGGAGEYASIYGGPGGGGGGGSSYIEPSATKFHSWQGWKNATSNGLVVFSWQ
jgi:Glycine rich protein